MLTPQLLKYGWTSWAGIPAPHYTYVKNINPGLPLFLFNYSDRKLHGIYEAASNGRLNINPQAWTEDGSDSTPYPAQVMHGASASIYGVLLAANVMLNASVFGC